MSLTTKPVSERCFEDVTAIEVDVANGNNPAAPPLVGPPGSFDSIEAVDNPLGLPDEYRRIQDEALQVSLTGFRTGNLDRARHEALKARARDVAVPVLRDHVLAAIENLNSKDDVDVAKVALAEKACLVLDSFDADDVGNELMAAVNPSCYAAVLGLAFRAVLGNNK